MPRFAANLSMLFTEVPFLERFAAAAAAGFEAVEYLFPYDYRAEEIKERLDANGLKQALFNLPPGDWAAGERGLAALPERVDEFRDSVRTALAYADVLETPKLHAMAGIASPDDPASHETFVTNLRYAADQAAPQGRMILVEPLNPYSTPGYFLYGARRGLDLVAEIDRPNVKFQLDLFHAQLTDGDITHLIEQAADRIGHVQLASVPHRNEPDRGELNYPFVLDVLDRHYDGWVGCEYNPAGETTAGLGWLEHYSGRRAQ